MRRRDFLRGALASFGVALVPAGLLTTTKALSETDKHRIIMDFIRTPEGRSKLAQAMMQPIRRPRDYASIGRKAFLVEAMPTSTRGPR